MSSSRFTAINGPSPPQTLKLSDSGSNLRLSQMGPPLQPPRELNTCLPNPTKRKRSSHNEVEKDDEEKDDTTLFAAAPKRYASASSAGVNVAYQPVPLLRGEVEAVGASRNDHHNDGPQLSEQVDRSKRKKTFSPRTKTGCGTCRKRKKKCDEAKPTCINCFKSGFTCAGYAPQPGCENPGPPTSYAENRGILPKQLYSPFYDEPRVQPGPFIAAPRLPPLPQLILLQPAATAQPAFQHQPRHQPPPLPRAPSLQQESEKLKMLAGRPFNPAAPELRALREECKYALSRFSQAAGVGAGIEEQMQRFWEILRPPPSWTRNPERVMVDQPFNCDYGFNLKIGNDVSIGKDCMVEDAAEVVIGDGCKLGPCVTISTMEWGRWTQDSDGERLATARMVRLESNVVVGAGARILPGSHIPSGTVVAPGEIVPRRS